MNPELKGKSSQSFNRVQDFGFLADANLELGTMVSRT